MDKDYNSIVVNQEVFTIEDAREAAQQLFEVQVDDFYALKNEKWYKHLLNAITFGSDRKKKVIKDIRSLSKLQTIFMRIYCENYKGLDSQLNEIIDNIAKTNESVRKIYVKYIVGIKPQQSILDLPQLDQDILLLFLCSYASNNGNDESFKTFRRGVAQTIGRGIPQSEFKPEMLGQIKSGDVFYRFIVEMCAIDDGLDDFSVPDNIYEAINYLTISNKARENIESQIRDELDNFGKDYLITKYRVSEERLIDDEIELKDEDTVNEDFAIITINKKLQIPKGKQQIYKNKEILIHATVFCEGELLFDNCTIKYNDSALSGHILIGENGKLSIIGCTFLCLSYRHDYFFLCKGEVSIKQSKFFDCSYLFVAWKDFFVEQCEMVNCASGLFSLWGDPTGSNVKITICNNKITQRDLKPFYKDNLGGLSGAMIGGLCENIYNTVFQFNNNVVTEEPEFAEIFKDTWEKFMYVDSNKMSITQSNFINTTGAIDSSMIGECYFKGCKNLIVMSESSKIENCIFEECENVISTRYNAIISNCQFVSCKNKLIDCHAYDDGGVIVDSCIFKNIQNDFDDFEGEDGVFDLSADSSALCFARSKGASSRENRIYNCSFDGVSLKKAFLIAPIGHRKPEDIVVSVDRCTFSHCVTQRQSKKIIREYISYYGLFNKEKSVHATDISDCKGLDKLNSEGSNAENLSINYTSTSGRKIGADLSLLE